MPYHATNAALCVWRAALGSLYAVYVGAMFG